ncbi:hypothetical protein P152DRAFT_470711 [Eremomyces bilateralis CBS 781.70]|uniref:P-loop containing nucleoside triphosphate hydrolase protein n=1 Tax=Eremomyces bilateralis CBS 781.70 TaxID=1392243 RepID=A0A6G1GF35_9PEZI|nr:uncharacterized protein P152DRAFT_470711 [Eremomyces bilateralis CBS 781.70]KAF1816725.1 hypothetical protein P152DRAFT_470711 [Eremomyces bilateralis CBS 781.70]
MPWISESEVPTANEFLDETDPLDYDPDNYSGPRNLVDGPWKSKEKYLETHYKLLRRDTVKPLRDAVQQLRSDPGACETDLGSTAGFYDRVHVTAVIPSTMGVAVKVVFSIQRIGKRVHWEQSSRLIQGSLVVLSPRDDCFRTTCLVATIAARPLSGVQQNPPEVDLFFARSEDLILDPDIEYVMLEERQSYFEAAKHTLVALQRMQHEKFPLAEHLVDTQSHVEAPAYLQANPTIDLRAIMPKDDQGRFETSRLNILTEWPSEDKRTVMDVSQWSALNRIMTKKIAIVQGPPGTGKTYVSVQAIRTLIDNMADEDPPIVVTCQTNHALDQLLRHIAEFEPGFLRLGGRSKDVDVVKKRTLYEVRCGLDMPRFLSGSLIAARKELQALAGDIALILEPIKLGSKCMIDAEFLRKFGIISDEQAQSLLRGGTEWAAVTDTTDKGESGLLGSWLGSLLTFKRKSFESDNFGYEFEEAELEFEQLREMEAETFATDEEEFEVLKGTTISIHDNFTAKGRVQLSDAECEKRLRNTDLYKIDFKDRPSVFGYLQRQVTKKVTELFKIKAKIYDEVATKRRLATFERDVPILAQQRVIGMTTTGFSKYRAMVAVIKPKIVLIEEAAETLEAPVIAACIPSLDHLILVGDHLQLRPHCNIRFHEGDPVNLNLSLFERLVNNGVEYNALRRQRRMIPEIRRILRPIYGDLIKDHDSVKDPANRPPVPGMGGCNSFFFSHTYPESRDDYMSAMNEQEAQMVVGFYEYLWMNGIDTTKMTILTFYNGQRKRLLRLLRQRNNLRNLRHNVVTVDSYQGEENDIVLLSLVRSNDNGTIGFLKVDNRVCVAISRAKRGFYMFGNAELLARESNTWGEICVMMYRHKTAQGAIPKSRVGFWLPITCKNHDRKMFLEDPDDWADLTGGCREECDTPLDCGHPCQLRCHPFAHNQIVCRSSCERSLPCGHSCGQICGEPCRCFMCPESNSALSQTARQTEGSPRAVGFLADVTQEEQEVHVAGWREFAQNGFETEIQALRGELHRPNSTVETTQNFGSIFHRTSYQAQPSTTPGPTPAEAAALARGAHQRFTPAQRMYAPSPAIQPASNSPDRNGGTTATNRQTLPPRLSSGTRAIAHKKISIESTYRLKAGVPAVPGGAPTPKPARNIDPPSVEEDHDLLVDFGQDNIVVQPLSNDTADAFPGPPDSRLNLLD